MWHSPQATGFAMVVFRWTWCAPTVTKRGRRTPLGVDRRRGVHVGCTVAGRAGGARDVDDAVHVGRRVGGLRVPRPGVVAVARVAGAAVRELDVGNGRRIAVAEAAVLEPVREARGRVAGLAGGSVGEPGVVRAVAGVALRRRRDLLHEVEEERAVLGGIGDGGVAQPVRAVEHRDHPLVGAGGHGVEDAGTRPAAIARPAHEGLPRVGHGAQGHRDVPAVGGGSAGVLAVAGRAAVELPVRRGDRPSNGAGDVHDVEDPELPLLLGIGRLARGALEATGHGERGDQECCGASGAHRGDLRSGKNPEKAGWDAPNASATPGVEPEGSGRCPM